MRRLPSVSRGFTSPVAVIFLAIMGLVSWYMNHNNAGKTLTATSTPAQVSSADTRSPAPSTRFLP